MRSSTPLGGALSTALPSLLIALAAPACGEDRQIPVEVLPSADETRTFFGLTNGSCIRYRFNTTLRATASVTGPNMTSIAGRTAYRRLFAINGAGPPDEWFIEGQDDGELRLLRLDTFPADERISTRYACVGTEMCPAPEEQEPTLLRLRFDDAMQVVAEQGDRFEVVTTPVSVTGSMAEPERHTVIVQQVGVDVPVPGGTTEPGVEMTYFRQVGNASPTTSTWRLVPGKGIAQIQEAGRTYQACAWRYCDAAGNCQGAPDCASLSCN